MILPNNALPNGFRIVGSCRNDRLLIDWWSAFQAYCDCDERAQIESEAYLSAFCFGCEFVELLNETGSTKGYSGKCWSPYLWFDVDDADLNKATEQTRRLTTKLVERYQVDDELLLFYSGSKGYHIGLPTSLWSPEPSESYHLQCRRLAEAVAVKCNVRIDTSVYDRVRAFRAPNSWHPKTGRHKRFLTLSELMMLRPESIIELAEAPEPFEIPTFPCLNRQAVDDWHSVGAVVEQQKVIKSDRDTSSSNLNRLTMEFIRDGALEGDRHRLLFSAAANLAEFACPYDLAWALLSETALDSCLAPSDVKRQIECGLKQGIKNNGS